MDSSKALTQADFSLWRFPHLPTWQKRRFLRCRSPVIHALRARIAASFASGAAEELQEVYFINSSSTNLQEWSSVCEPRRSGRGDSRENLWREWKRVKHEYCEGEGYRAEEICCRLSSWGLGGQVLAQLGIFWVCEAIYTQHLQLKLSSLGGFYKSQGLCVC